jgi:hypothetical protein
MNKILISENAFNQMIFVRFYRIFSNFKMFNYYLLLSYVEVSELTGHVRTSGFYGKRIVFGAPGLYKQETEIRCRKHDD